MNFKERMNRAVFGLGAAALQLLPGQAKAEGYDCTCEFEAYTSNVSMCFDSGNSIAECLTCAEESYITSLYEALDACISGTPLVIDPVVICNIGGSSGPG